MAEKQRVTFFDIIWAAELLSTRSLNCLGLDGSDCRLSPANGLLAAQYQGASFCKTEWCASNQVLQLPLGDLRASNWRADKQSEFLYAPCLRGWGLKSRVPAARSSREVQVQRRHHSKE